jgi:uncharacterized protein (TIGR00369 family)
MTATYSPIPPPVPANTEWAQWVQWANRLPNFSEICMSCVEVSAGVCVATLDGSRFSPNPNGAVNGGLVLSAADQCMGVVALSTLEAGSLAVTATISAEFLRPAFPELTLRANVSQRGRNLVFVTVNVHDLQGRLAVKCSGTMAAQDSGRHVPASRSGG